MTDLLHSIINDDADEEYDITMEIINQMDDNVDINDVCKYYDLITYNKLTCKRSPHYAIMHMNVRCLTNKFDEIKAILGQMSTKPIVIAITETWLSVSDTNSYNISGYTSYHLVRTLREHGGVSLFISNEFVSSQINSISYVSDIIEVLTVKFSVQNHSYTLCSVYRPDDKYHNVDKFTNELLTILNHKEIVKSNTVLVGDLNINLLEHSTHQPTANFLNAMQSIRFHPHITKPTRFPDQNQQGLPSLLDHIFVNFSAKSKAGILHYPVSDHLPVFFHFELHKKNHQSHEVTIGRVQLSQNTPRSAQPSCGP